MNTKFALPEVGAPANSDSLFGVIWPMLRRMPNAFIYRSKSPLHNEDGKFIIGYTLLDEATRRSAYATNFT